MTYQIDFKHVDMKVALDLISEKISDIQRRIIHYKKLSPTSKVQIPDRFGNQIYEAREMVWLYEHELKTIQGLNADIYELFKLPVAKTTIGRSSWRSRPGATSAAAPSEQDGTE